MRRTLMLVAVAVACSACGDEGGDSQASGYAAAEALWWDDSGCFALMHRDLAQLCGDPLVYRVRTTATGSTEERCATPESVDTRYPVGITRSWGTNPPDPMVWHTDALVAPMRETVADGRVLDVGWQTASATDPTLVLDVSAGCANADEEWHVVVTPDTMPSALCRPCR